MTKSVPEAIEEIEGRGLLRRSRENQSAKVIPHVSELLGCPLPADLAAFYTENVEAIGYCNAVAPLWKERVGWTKESSVTELLHVRAVPVISDDFGNLYGLDLASGAVKPAVYFFDHENMYEKAEFAAGSSLAAFLLVLAEEVAAPAQDRPTGWQLAIDPDLDKCTRAPPIWLAG